MTVRSRFVAGFALLCTLALGPVRAGDDEVYVRIVQVKGTGSRAENKKADVEKALEPFRAHLEQASQHAKYASVGKGVVKKGPFGKAVSFDLENHLRAEATATSGADKKIKLVLKVNKNKDKKDELVFETTLEMKDAATAIAVLEKALEGGDLLLAVTSSRDSL